MKVRMLILVCALACGSLLVVSCNRGVGCPATEEMRKNEGKQMNTKKRGSSTLFPKNM